MSLPLFDLHCSDCSHPYPRTSLAPRCPECGGFWEFGADLAWQPPRDEPGLRAWAHVFGVEPDELPARFLSRAPRRLGGAWVAQQGSPFELGGRLFAGSFKERGAEVLVAACARRGAREVFLDSSGNAGIAVARASAVRGITCSVLVPETTPEVKLDALRALGADVEVVSGDRRATHQRALERIAPAGPVYASHVVQPFFLAGVATLAWDLAEKPGAATRDEASAATPRRIDRVLLPASNGSLLLGLGLGFDLLARAGAIERPPSLHAVQLAGYATLAPEGPGERDPGPPRAAGLAIADPPRRAQMAALVRRTGGDVTMVREDDIAAARTALAAEGLVTDPTGAAAWAALAKRPELRGEGTVVVLTSREG